MFDDFRKQAEQSELEQPVEKDIYEFRELPGASGRLLGMTPAQRFVLAFMLLFMALLLSTLCLLVTQKVMPGL